MDLTRRTMAASVPALALAGCSAASLNGPAPMPGAATDEGIRIAYMALSTALMALGYVPTVPQPIVAAAQVVLDRLRLAYAAYTDNPSGTLRQQLNAAIEAALGLMARDGRVAVAHAEKLVGARSRIH